MATSSIPQNCSNQRKSVLPAVCANGRFNVGSRGPGACPMIITSLTIAPPETGVDFMRGQRRQRCNRLTCRLSSCCGLALVIFQKRCEDAPHSQSTSCKEKQAPIYFAKLLECDASSHRFHRRKIEKSDRSKLKTMLITMQVTMGK